MTDNIYINRPNGPIFSVDRWKLQEIISEARRSPHLDKEHQEVIKKLIDHLCHTPN